MAYNKRNLLTKIAAIQRITREHTDRGVTQKWVYDNVIYPQYYISIATFYNYLEVPAARELKKIESAQSQQGRLF